MLVIRVSFLLTWDLKIAHLPSYIEAVGLCVPYFIMVSPYRSINPSEYEELALVLTNIGQK